MEMFLMAATMSLLGVAISALMFATATRGTEAAPTRPAEGPALEPQRFFAEPAAVAMVETVPASVPLEALLLQIERHIRLEQAAAESFLEMPTGSALHSRTVSPLVN